MQTLVQPSQTDSPDFKRLIEQGADEIVKLWLQDVRADCLVPLIVGEQEPILLASIPLVISEILRVIELDESKIEHEKIRSAARHGSERARQHFDIKVLVHECQILRRHIFHFLQDHQELFAANDLSKMTIIFQRVGLAIDEATREIINAFSEEQTDNLRHLSRTDSLTGLFNHRTFYERLDEELKRAQRYESPLSIVFIDLDNFKTVNDTLGHPFGDCLLVKCAKWLSHELRQTDSICRYGGDEFAVILPETNIEDARIMMERLAGKFKRFGQLEGAPTSFGMSFGISSHPEDDGSVQHLVEAADERLRFNKQKKDQIQGINTIRGFKRRVRTT
jgi:diguanylate cyclase (GGDEF)-like protein